MPVLPASCRVLDLVRDPFRHPHSCQESRIYRMLWSVYDFALGAELGDESTIRKLAVSMGLEASRRDLPWHRRAQRLWDMFDITGVHFSGGKRNPEGLLRQPAWR